MFTSVLVNDEVWASHTCVSLMSILHHASVPATALLALILAPTEYTTLCLLAELTVAIEQCPNAIESVPDDVEGTSQSCRRVQIAHHFAHHGQKRMTVMLWLS
jgi:hypothetical protein